GPGEALMTDIGLTGGGNGTHQIYLSGEKAHRLKEGDESVIDHLVRMVEERAAETEPKSPRRTRA
ncbi:MAG: 4-hydroxy-3-methylbut-2-en-1-yl diphosphate synthase, partial [Alphaproteobacteria bacterium]|nr:4-hydroxy-3-methylbut-2-en-1-yl diphosphate synthase [Alphaproteobacteria bacterium]